MRPAFGRRFGQRGPVLSTETVATFDGECRVCKGPIVPGTLVRSRTWHVERAHLACGWLAPEETTLHQAALPEGFGLYWQWQCPECRLDAVGRNRPAAGEDLRCFRCRRVELGVRVSLVRPVTWRVGGREIVLPPSTAGVVKELRDGERVLVALDRPLKLTTSKGELVLGAMLFGRELLRREPASQGGAVVAASSG